MLGTSDRERERERERERDEGDDTHRGTKSVTAKALYILFYLDQDVVADRETDPGDQRTNP
jgi:hypothetical protein